MTFYYTVIKKYSDDKINKFHEINYICQKIINT